MKASNIIFTATVATSAMTLYSYVISLFKKKNFSEPETLGEIIHSLLPTIRKRYAFVAGWSAHYLVGLIFAIVYIYLWEKKRLQPTKQNGLLLGGISGIVAIIVWKAVVSVTPDPPKRDYKQYYMQLLPAHVVFGIAAFIAYSAHNRMFSRV